MADQLLDDARGWVERISRDPSLALHPAVLDVVRRLADSGRNNEVDVALPLGWLHWYRHVALPEGQSEDELLRAMECFIPCFLSGAGPIPDRMLPLLFGTLFDLAVEWSRDLQQTDDSDLLNLTLHLWRRLAAAAPSTFPDRMLYQSNLAATLMLRHARTGRPEDLDEAVVFFRLAAGSGPDDHPDRPGLLGNLGVALQTRFERTGEPEDLAQSIEARRAAIAAAGVDHSDLAGFHVGLTHALREQFLQSGSEEDLDVFISALRQTIGHTTGGTADEVASLLHLGQALRMRFEILGEDADLEESISVARDAERRAPGGTPLLSYTQTVLSASLQFRFRRHGAVEDLDEALAFARTALESLAEDDLERGEALANLASAMADKYQREGIPADIQRAAELSRAAVRSAGPDDRKRFPYLLTLTVIARQCYARTGALEDLDEALRAARAALEIPGAPRFQRILHMANTASLLLDRYLRLQNPEDLTHAGLLFEATVAQTPEGHPEHAGRILNLSIALRYLFHATGESEHLRRAATLLRQVLTSAAPDAPERPRYLYEWATTLKALHQQGDGSVTWSELVAAAEEAAHCDSDAIVHTPARLLLARTLLLHAQDPGHSASAERALSVLTDLLEAPHTTPSQRIEAARLAASVGGRSRTTTEAASLLEGAVHLMPEVAPLQLAWQDRQHALGGLAGLAAEAAGAVLGSSAGSARQRALRALQLLEMGRSVLLSQVLRTRGDLSDLHERHPELADRFAQLRHQLDRDADARSILTRRTTAVSEEDRHARQALARDFAATTARIRALPGFATFMRPPGAEELIAAASDGPVVTFTTQRSGTEALIITASGVTHLHLPGIRESELMRHVEAFHEALEGVADPGVPWRKRVAYETSLSETLKWLWDEAVSPTMDRLGLRARQAAHQPWPRIWWVPGGLLGLLPLHAAGYHEDGDGRTVLDRAISSYTPTLSALRHARSTPSVSRTDRALVVAMPTTPGAGPLRSASEEIRAPGALWPDPIVFVEGPTVSAHTPTKAGVLAALPHCTIAHFSCHGASDPIDPSNSRLLLHDHQVDPLTAASLTTVNLGHARLVYLSACRTAFSSTRELIDETIHLASAFQLAGFQHVIGTLWEIEDGVAAKTAARFYNALSTADGSLRTHHAAHALHHSVRAARHQFPVTPSLWAGLVHAGP
ncbi:CHAT domain-containing protein [Streptomyces sp. NPDC044571]|uniref:CHAT domain-containing protein n=1 Tax=Streptomyces sp. NPDC044571 TaxID=3155371 RepID=UPI0033EC28E7